MSDKPLPYPLLLPPALRERIQIDARRLNLSQSDLMRQAMELGMPLLLERSRNSGSRVTNVAPLPKGALIRAYRQEESNGREWRPPRFVTHRLPDPRN